MDLMKFQLSTPNGDLIIKEWKELFMVSIMAGEEHLALPVKREELQKLHEWLCSKFGHTIIPVEVKKQFISGVEAVNKFLPFACEFLGVTEKELFAHSKLRTKSLSNARAILSHVITRELGLSTPVTGKLLNVHHATVVMGRKKVESDMEHYSGRVLYLRENLRRISDGSSG